MEKEAYTSIDKKSCLITTDGWETFEYKTNNEVELKVNQFESNTKKAYEAKLRYWLKDSKANIIIKEFEKIRKEVLCHNSAMNNYGNEFEVFAIATLCKCGYRYAYENYIVKGGQDAKIDAWVYDNELEETVAYQIKMALIEDDVRNIMTQNINRLFNQEADTIEDGQDLIKFYEDHKKELEAKDYIIKTISINSKLDNITPEEIFDEFFKNFKSKDTNGIVLEINKSSNEQAHTIACANEGVYAFFIKADEFLDTLIKYNKYDNLEPYFYDNVRAYLKDNKQIQNTIQNEPTDFVMYNNGITIVGQFDLLNNRSTFKIKNPIITNGQQTVLNLYNARQKGNDLSEINLLIILKKTENNFKKLNIARFTNSQTKVKNVDLLSLNTNIREFSNYIYDTYFKEEEFYLKINTSGDKEIDLIAKQVFKNEKYKIIKLVDFLRIYSCELEDLGRWYGATSTMLDKLVENDIDIDTDKGVRVCKIIVEFYKNIEQMAEEVRGIYQIVSIPFMYIMREKNLNFVQTKQIMDQVIKIGEKETAKLSDIIKSSKISKILKRFL